MLDQNTDRILNLILVVVIGALLFGMVNGTIPNIFAGITDGYVEEVGDAPEPDPDPVPSGEQLTDGTTPEERPEDPNTIDASGMTLEEYIISLVPNYPPENLELVRTPYHAYYSTHSEFMNQYFSNTSQEYDMYNLHGTDFYRQVDPEGDVASIKVTNGDRITQVYVRNSLAAVEGLEQNTKAMYSEYYGSEIRPVKLAYGTYYQLIIEYK